MSIKKNERLIPSSFKDVSLSSPGANVQIERPDRTGKRMERARHRELHAASHSLCPSTIVFPSRKSRLFRCRRMLSERESWLSMPRLRSKKRPCVSVSVYVCVQAERAMSSTLLLLIAIILIRSFSRLCCASCALRPASLLPPGSSSNILFSRPSCGKAVLRLLSIDLARLAH